ncbi:MAG TPA: FKBP-type peptidyl-prolyl cis-trans isomerase [Kofleriaceae bacterium]|nr:FKBP-type peptidyl-prolyl cis-trans isomerase [Kofleriaceae bacterium]
MLTPVSTRPRLSVALLVYPFVLGLAFYATSSLAQRAGNAWSPQPSWTRAVEAPPPGAPIDTPVDATSDQPATIAPTAADCIHEMGSGIRYNTIAVTSAPSALVRPADTVTLRLRGWTTDGAALEIPREPVTFPVNRLIPGFVTGLGLMAVGDRWLLCIPEHLAYQGREGSPQGTLVFDVEVLALERGITVSR